MKKLDLVDIQLREVVSRVCIPWQKHLRRRIHLTRVARVDKALQAGSQADAWLSYLDTCIPSYSANKGNFLVGQSGDHHSSAHFERMAKVPSFCHHAALFAQQT